MSETKIVSGLMGVCVGDALGVPVEFQSRQTLAHNPVATMRGYGTYNQPPGTWSDDSSLTFCLAEALAQELLSEQLVATVADYFCLWRDEAFWTPYEEVFDIGLTTNTAISRLRQGISPTEAGGLDERSNGNGSLMRILPLAFCYPLVKFPQLIQRVHEVSCLTHAHPRSQMACGIYVSIAIGLLQGLSPFEAYQQGIEQIKPLYQNEPYQSQLSHFQRFLDGNIAKLPVNEIASSGYVVHTLEAAIWCFLNYQNYAESVVVAVNLGEDTDTTAAVTGGLAGIYYEVEQIPQHWVETIARKDDIIGLGKRLSRKIGNG
ncbi:ADP-ribosylglycohydrolase family protein [Spirulina sp. CS-785/01]|uniref:ADP-ribosylglycohydrolase family protein n=1 Tax=Spirulina sp. CS-785/01 TaxID=3021716 RepID=UPI00232C1D66|nr:ADP-ribosylglycohydrolase family protein [Spirulina sp. CS-785/01]MDB9312326.1 ADP-ribosylglycohydrolase family protein [Spirulina sp. CS-785/01]